MEDELVLGDYVVNLFAGCIAAVAMWLFLALILVIAHRIGFMTGIRFFSWWLIVPSALAFVALLVFMFFIDFDLRSV